jgi:PIN domain nuclease of toxin-antitoxin system
MSFVGVADTHAALWYVFDDPRLSFAAGRFIDEALANGMSIAVSPISLAEIVYLQEKKRLPADSFGDLKRALTEGNHVFKQVAFTMEVAEAMRLVPRDAIPDMPDRIVAATAIHLSVPLLSRDGRIRASTIDTIW